MSADRRRLEARPDPEAERDAAAAAAEYLDVRLRLARVLLRIERGGTFHLAGCSSAVQYGVRLGIPAAEARALVDLGRTLELARDEVCAATGVDVRDGERVVDDRVRAGRLPVEGAAIVGKLLRHPGCVRPGEDWVRRASEASSAELRREVHRRIEECAQGEAPLVSFTVHVTDRTRDDFRRVQVLASRRAERVLTLGQTFTLLVRRYLSEADPRMRGAKPRRVPPTAESPGERYVPAEVRRSVLERSHDRCEVPGCDFDTFLAFAHIEAHARGGDREAENLLRLCTAHHTQLDAGCLRFAGWRDGKPVFRLANGVEVVAPAPLPERCNAHDGRGRTYDDRDGEDAGRAVTSQVSERPPPAWVVTTM